MWRKYNLSGLILVGCVLMMGYSNTLDDGPNSNTLNDGTNPTVPTNTNKTEEDNRDELDTQSPPVANITTDSNYNVLLFLAQKEAQCLQSFGFKHRRDEDMTITLDEDTEIFINFRCVKDTPSYLECQQCQSLVEMIPTEDRCRDLCDSSEDIDCSTKCNQLLETVKNLKSGNSSYPMDAASKENETPENILKINPPNVFCEDMSRPDTTDQPEFHVVVLKWTLDLQTVNSTTPIIFVLQRLDVPKKIEQDTILEWETRGKTINLMLAMNSPYLERRYIYRITAIGPDGLLSTTISSPIKTHNGFVKATPPKELYIVKKVVHDNSLDVLIGWDSPADKPCDYKVQQYQQDGEGKSTTRRFTAPDLENGLHVWFYDLKFSKTYDVGITSRRANWNGFESDINSVSFKMPTCLEAHNHRFDKCVPSQPKNITHENVIIPEGFPGSGDTKSGRDKQIFGNVKIKWDPPPFTSSTNPLKGYTLIVGVPYNSKQPTNDSRHHSSAQTEAMASISKSQTTFNIPGDATQFVIENLTLNLCYPIALIATSIKGDSPAAYGEVLTYVDVEESTPITSWVYVSIPISLLIIGLFGCHFIRLRLQKRKVKLARKQYFQSMDERDAMSADWSIVPLNEDSPDMKLLNEGPKEKWEISYENLILGEVIGQGAFGVVRRAQIARNKIHLSRQLKSITIDSEGDENSMETVAVKMLKVSATREDRDQLIKEILTMQNLGVHPQIVSLLGACTKGRSLCLVLEFCPGGDLLSFLRKVRAKYWPTLGLSGGGNCGGGGRGSWSDKSQERHRLLHRNPPPSTSCGGSSGSTSSESDNTVNSKCSEPPPINYADMTSPECSNTTADRLGPPTNTVINHQYGRTPLDEVDDCRPIDEKDILSYARQISMGMEYLEKNRVVHRDLAGRNVLLLGDYKQVKISDFGLSRDIYTWNVYHQKTNGKLPIKWMAIESIFTHVFTSKSDVWSFGILLWELVTLGGTPYPGLSNNELFHLLKTGYRMERPDNSSEELYALMKKCWRTSPVSRPNFTELRRYLETMLETAEPSLYLSLMADIPLDYFHLSSKSDLLHLKLDDDSPLRESAGGTTNPSGSNGGYAANKLGSAGSTASTRKQTRYSKYPVQSPIPNESNPKANSNKPIEIQLQDVSTFLRPSPNIHDPPYKNTGKSALLDSPRPQVKGDSETLRSPSQPQLPSVPDTFPPPLNRHTGSLRSHISNYTANNHNNNNNVNHGKLSSSLKSRHSLRLLDSLTGGGFGESPLGSSEASLKRFGGCGSSESLMSPDSGLPRSEVGRSGEADDTEEDQSPVPNSRFMRLPRSVSEEESDSSLVIPQHLPYPHPDRRSLQPPQICLIENQTYAED